jgi:hypothetical protein
VLIKVKRYFLVVVFLSQKVLEIFAEFLSDSTVSLMFTKCFRITNDAREDEMEDNMQVSGDNHY